MPADSGAVLFGEALLPSPLSSLSQWVSAGCRRGHLPLSRLYYCRALSSLLELFRSLYQSLDFSSFLCIPLLAIPFMDVSLDLGP